jgi:hypothetical protein
MYSKLVLYIVVVFRISARVESQAHQHTWHDLGKEAEALLWKDCGIDCVKVLGAHAGICSSGLCKL